MLLRGAEFVTYSKNAILEILGGHTENTDFNRIFHMFADAGAEIKVANAHYTDAFDSFGQTGEVEVTLSFFKGDHCVAHLKISGNGTVDGCFDVLHFAICQGSVEVIVTLGFFAVHMGAKATSAVECPDHDLIEYMFRRMHARGARICHIVLLIVVEVKNKKWPMEVSATVLLCCKIAGGVTVK